MNSYHDGFSPELENTAAWHGGRDEWGLEKLLANVAGCHLASRASLPRFRTINPRQAPL